MSVQKSDLDNYNSEIDEIKEMKINEDSLKSPIRLSMIRGKDLNPFGPLLTLETTPCVMECESPIKGE